ncbi:MAG: GyrI-like domain-containing protein [Alkalimonas sp.]|nr:GyrI-like domain-containing protein [Alkalimonas sp.]
MKDVVFRLGFEVSGIFVNSYAHIESDPVKALLPRAWQLYFDLFYPGQGSSDSSFAVYHYPDPSQPEHFEVCIGTTATLKNNEHGYALKTSRVPSGRYMFFTAKGSFPAVAQQLWQEVRDYFLAPDCACQRAYITDFEEVLPTGQLVIGVSVH